jgi:hypothetical protein
MDKQRGTIPTLHLSHYEPFLGLSSHAVQPLIPMRG